MIVFVEAEKAFNELKADTKKLGTGDKIKI